MSTLQDAARRVAECIRDREEPDLPDLIALLPVLDAVAAGQDGSRSEHWRGALWAAINAQNPFYASVLHIDRIADAAIALADAERAAVKGTEYEAEGTDLWTTYEAARDLYAKAERLLERVDTDDPEDNIFVPAAKREVDNDRAALDAAVRRLAGLDPTSAPPR